MTDKEYSDRIIETSEIDDPKLNIEGLTDVEKMELYVFAWNQRDLNPTRTRVEQFFNWTTNHVRKLYKKSRVINEPTFSESTGMLCGSGYYLTSQL